MLGEKLQVNFIGDLKRLGDSNWHFGDGNCHRSKALRLLELDGVGDSMTVNFIKTFLFIKKEVVVAI